MKLNRAQSTWFALICLALIFFATYVLAGLHCYVDSYKSLIIGFIQFFLMGGGVLFFGLIASGEFHIELPRFGTNKDHQKIKDIILEKMREAEGSELDELIKKYESL